LEQVLQGLAAASIQVLKDQCRDIQYLGRAEFGGSDLCLRPRDDIMSISDLAQTFTSLDSLSPAQLCPVRELKTAMARGPT